MAGGGVLPLGQRYQPASGERESPRSEASRTSRTAVDENALRAALKRSIIGAPGRARILADIVTGATAARERTLCRGGTLRSVAVRAGAYCILHLRQSSPRMPAERGENAQRARIGVSAG